MSERVVFTVDPADPVDEGELRLPGDPRDENVDEDEPWNTSAEDVLDEAMALRMRKEMN